jgi:hypothetical protein
MSGDDLLWKSVQDGKRIETVVGNVEYSFSAFHFLRNETCLTDEGCHFQKLI